jgi:hypothetical protein
VVQEYHAIRDHVGVVIGQADCASAQANMAGATCGGGNKHFRRGDSLPAPAVVLADPRFIESQVVQPLDQLSISFQGQGRVLAHSVKGSHECPEGHVVSEHRHFFLLRPLQLDRGGELASWGLLVRRVISGHSAECPAQ